MKWQARAILPDDVIAVDAPTVGVLQSGVRLLEPAHWTVWCDGEYRETWTTLYFSPGHERFGELFCTHTHDGKKGSAPRPPKEI